MFKDAFILVTGGTGSWGKELILQLLKQNPKKVIVLSRNEDKQVSMRREFDDPRLSFLIGDIRDKEALSRAFRGIDYVFHLAALKHVPVCEECPLEALKTNINGTQNVIDAAILNDVKKVIHVSTDKSVDPANFYGFTKAVSEKLINHANESTLITKFICVRSGNVLGTSGSVLKLFIDQIINDKEITITDKKMTRFFLTLEDAIKLLMEAATDGIGGEIFVLNMPSCRITDLAEVLLNYFGKNVKVTEIGTRPGEKLFEVLLSQKEIKNAVIYKQNYFVIVPERLPSGVKEQYIDCQPLNQSTYCSNDNLMNQEEILE
ncbi:MAG: UDP-N-acetylglucosamine 4,6-dehydratase, partial [Bacillales bacterium]|nr:UDP-N-acetylglucosamine 4,6-dehydratase [Bacillales bacterium]